MLKNIMLIIAAFILGGFILSDKSTSELADEAEVIKVKLTNLANEGEYAIPLPTNDSEDTWNMFGEDGEEEPIVPAYVLTTEEYIEAYRVDALEADKKYSGKMLELTGQITDVSIDDRGKVLMLLDMFIYVYPNPGEEDEYLKVNKFGKKITLWCYGGYKVFDNPLKIELNGCHIR